MRTQVWRPKTHKVSASHRAWRSRELGLGRGSTGFSTQVNSSRTARSAEAESPCNSHLFLPSTNQACGSSHATLDSVSSSRHGQTAQADVSLAKGIHENSRETFPPSQAPPVATRRKPLSWPYSPALARREAHSLEQVGSCPFWVCLHCRNNLSLEEPGCGRYCHPWRRSHLQRGQDQKLSVCPGSHTPSRGSAAGTYEVLEQPPLLSHCSLLCTSPSSCRHPHHTGCQGRARSWFAWLSRYDNSATPMNARSTAPWKESDVSAGLSSCPAHPRHCPHPTLDNQPSVPTAGSPAVRTSWKIIYFSKYTEQGGSEDRFSRVWPSQAS